MNSNAHKTTDLNPLKRIILGVFCAFYFMFLLFQSNTIQTIQEKDSHKQTTTSADWQNILVQEEIETLDLFSPYFSNENPVHEHHGIADIRLPFSLKNENLTFIHLDIIIPPPRFLNFA